MFKQQGVSYIATSKLDPVSHPALHTSQVKLSLGLSPPSFFLYPQNLVGWAGRRIRRKWVVVLVGSAKLAKRSK